MFTKDMEGMHTDGLTEWEREDLANCLERAESRWHRWRARNRTDPLRKAMWEAMTDEQRSSAFDASISIPPQTTKQKAEVEVMRKMGAEFRKAVDAEALRIAERVCGVRDE